jgi:hypothetical protein
MELVMRAEELMLRVSRVDRVPSEVVKSNKQGIKKCGRYPTQWSSSQG